MEIINFSNREFEKLPQYKLQRGIFNTEAKLYIYDTKDKWNHVKDLVKIFFVQEGSYFSNKLYTLNELMDFREKQTVKEIITPTKLVAIDGKICGYVQRLIENNQNLVILLKDPNVSLEEKINLLFKTAKLLVKIEKNPICRKYGFYIGDLHESNFIYDFDDNEIKSIDTDSCKIGRNKPSKSKYLTFNDKLWDYPKKYPLDSEDIHISNYNTSIISYIYMILSFFGDVNMKNVSVGEYYNYLQYLKDCGLSAEFIDMCAQIYLPSDNYLDPELIKSIDGKTLKKIQEKDFYKVIK